MKKKISAAFPCLVLALFPLPGISAEKPNIVLIMADDIGLGDIGMQHRERTGKATPAPTPQLDQLASEGLWCTDAHSPTSLCSPSRYAVMCGNYNFRSHAPWGVWGSFRPSPFSWEDATLGRVLRRGGYTTGFIGKWHLGGDFQARGSREIFRGNDRAGHELDVDMRRWIGGGPQDCGFDYDFTVPTGVQGPLYLAYENGVWYPLSGDSSLVHYDEQSAPDPLFVADKGPGPGDSNWDPRSLNRLLAAKAAGFIRENAGEDPFFLYYCTPAVHVPHTPPQELDGKAIAGTTPTRHLDMNRVLDWEVAQIVDALKASGVYEDTLLIFFSDNGGLWDPVAERAGYRSNGGFKANKNSPFEGGQRVPLIVVWPGVIQPGRRSNALINGTDFVATFAAIARVPLEENQAMDSRSFLPLLAGDPAFRPRASLCLQAGSQYELMYREGPWKIIIESDFQTTKQELAGLYNLEMNPTEKDSLNLLDDPAHRDRAQAMHRRYRKIRESGERTVPLCLPEDTRARLQDCRWPGPTAR